MLFIVLTIAYSASMIVAFMTHRWGIAIVDTLAYAWVLAITVIKRLPFWFRMYSSSASVSSR